MASARLIKRRINSAKNIAKITGAMEMVAASKMKRAQDQALEARPYARALETSLKKVAQLTDPSLHPLLSNHQEGIPILLIYSTDKGLCGSLNTNLLKTAMHWQIEHPEGQIVAVGRKAVMFSKFVGLPIFAKFTNLPEKVTLSSLLPVSELIRSKFLTKELRSVELLYTDFVNTLSQRPRIAKILPVKQEEAFESERLVTPEAKAEYIFEPSAQQLLSTLLPYYIENTLYQLMLESRASEHSARMVAMKNASENAGELVDELKLIFNKSRQASITSELLDITTATLSIKQEENYE